MYFLEVPVTPCPLGWYQTTPGVESQTTVLWAEPPSMSPTTLSTPNRENKVISRKGALFPEEVFIWGSVCCLVCLLFSVQHSGPHAAGLGLFWVMTHSPASDDYKYSLEGASGGNHYENRHRNQTLSLSQTNEIHLGQHATYYCPCPWPHKTKISIT